MPAVNKQEEEEVNSLLSSQRNSTIANFIMHKTCQIFYGHGRKLMPLSFVEFMFGEFKRYDVLSIPAVNAFFKEYKPSDLPAIIENYEENFFTLISGVSNKADEPYLRVQNNEYMLISLAGANMFADYDPDVYQNLENISSHIENSDELLSVKELYEQFMIRKIVLARSNRRRNIKNAQQKGSVPGATVTKAITKGSEEDTNGRMTIASENPNEDATLVGDKLDLPNMRGKVVRMFFPKLTLPSPYPVLQEKSRINSEHRARRFVSNDRQVKLLNEHKFDRIKYKTGFIEKRKAAQKAPKRKFDFDF